MIRYLGEETLETKLEKGQFLGLHEALEPEELAKILASPEIVVTDLDYCLADCLAIKLPLIDLKQGKAFNPKYMVSAFKAISRARSGFLSGGREGALEGGWRAYKELFLQEEEDLRRIEQLATQELHNLLYPGVEEFYALLSGTHKVMVTRNILELTRPFANHLGFDEVDIRTKIYDKAREVYRFIRDHPDFSFYYLIGDYESISKLTWIVEHERIIPTVIYVSKFPEIPDYIKDLVDVHIGRDYRPLVKLIGKYKQESDLPHPSS